MTRKDLAEFFEHKGIPASLTKDVTLRCVGIACPFCYDSGFHCGVFPPGNFSCWKCGSRGTPSRLAKALGIPVDEYLGFLGVEAPVAEEDALSKVREILDRQLISKPRDPVEKIPNEAVPVSAGTIRKNRWLRAFLERRGITLKTCIDHNVLYCPTGGRWGYRLIVPIYRGTEVRGFQGRDVSGRARASWLTANGFKEINEMLYPYPEERVRRVIIVEGVFDQWRIGEGSFATFGTNLSPVRRLLLIKVLRPMQLVFAWDSDAYGYALKAAKEMLPFVSDVRVLRLPEGEDPDSLGRGELVRMIPSAPAFSPVLG